MKLYSLELNGQLICEVTADVPVWLPVRPKLNQAWLKGLINQGLHNYFAQQQQKVSTPEVIKV